LLLRSARRVVHGDRVARLLGSPDRVLLLVKIVGALVLIGVATVVSLLFIKPVLTTESVVDQGPRALVIVATSGGDRDHGIVFRSHVDEAGRYRFTFYFTAADVTYGEGGNAFPVEYRITFAGDLADKGVTCGTSPDPVARQAFGNLSPGTQAALRLDTVGGQASSTSPQGSDQRGSVEAGQYPEFRGEMWLLDDQTSYDERYEDGGTVWAESCTLPEDAVWRQASDTGPAQGDRRTLLAPQFNWTSLEETTDHQDVLTSRLVVERAPGMALTEAYPSPQVEADAWSYQFETSWQGYKGQADNVGYTDQPVFIFQDRNLPTREALLMLGAGAALGFVGSLVVVVLTRILDLGWSWWRETDDG
jgi:hypothetical protein